MLNIIGDGGITEHHHYPCAAQQLYGDTSKMSAGKTTTVTLSPTLDAKSRLPFRLNTFKTGREHLEQKRRGGFSPRTFRYDPDCCH